MLHFNPAKKHDAILLVDCLDGNPNGDPDAGNQPRIDPETRHGLISDACMKRKVRNYVGITKKEEVNYKIFVEEGSVLNEKIEKAYSELKIEVKKKESTPEQQEKARNWMIENFYDIRMFGAVLSTGLNAGQVWGPLQISWGRSYDPVLPISATITRCAATEAKEKKDNKTMGRKELIPYGLFKIEIHYNPGLGDKVSSDDLQLFWESLLNCWEFDRSSSRSSMNCRGLFVFTHDSKWGNVASHKLFDLLSVKSIAPTPRSINDYEVNIDGKMPDGVTLWESR